MTADENTPLLGSEKRSRLSSLWSPANRVLLAGFIITLSFSFTQVPLLYVFREMECDVFYETHPPYEGTGDRCSRNEIAAGTATQFSILGMSTTFCGVLNLFVTGWNVKKFGPRSALLLQTLIPAIRVLTQIIGVVVGAQKGIYIIQLTQVITILGGPVGYILVVNTIAGEVVEPAQRTALFGKLQGCIMLGQALGFWIGGKLGDEYGTKTPFETAFCCFCVATVYARLTLPYISPAQLSDPKKAPAKGLSGFLAPLKVLAPQTLRLRNGKVVKHFGVLFLCCGIFLGVLATGYAPIVMQMYATTVFHFDQEANGLLMSGNALMRAFFLIVIFPRIISYGRKWYSSRQQSLIEAEEEEALPTDPGEFDATSGGQGNEPLNIKPLEDRTAYGFDLFFLRWSLVVDGALTATAAFATQGWHAYLVAFLLPFGSGSAPAAKGVITEMCPSAQRADALNAVTLVENMARLSTLGLFGFIFAALADIGQVHLTFFVNGAIAVLGMSVLLLSHFPPQGGVLIDDAETEPLCGDTENEGNA